MSFTALPFWAVLGLAAASAGVLALLHLLRVRPREIRVVTTLFWSYAIERSRARTLWERFRHPLTYALLLGICVLLSLVLGRPERATSAQERMHAVIVVDAGASMAAPEAGGGTRLDAARRRLAEQLDRLGATDAVAVVVADPMPRLLADFDLPRPLITRRLQDVSPASIPAGRQQALRLARSMAEGRSQPAILLITDRSLEPMAGDPGPGLQPSVVFVGTPVNNAAIVGGQFLPDEADPLSGQVAARVFFSGDKPSSVTALFENADGEVLLSQSQVVSPGETVDFTSGRVRADGQRIRIRLIAVDGLDADNVASVRVPLRMPIRMRVRSELPLAVRLALESNPAVRLVAVDEDGDVDVVENPSQASLSRPAVVLRSAGSPADSQSQVVVNSDEALVRDLDFEAGVCGSGGGLGSALEGTVTWLACGDVPVASWHGGGGPPRLELGSAFYAADGTAIRRAAFAVLLGRGICRLAGWEHGPVVLTPDRALDDPCWPSRALAGAPTAVMPTGRAAADLARKAPADDPVALQAGRGRLLPFEWLLVVALAVFLVESFLHARGRIS